MGTDFCAWERIHHMTALGHWVTLTLFPDLSGPRRHIQEAQLPQEDGITLCSDVPRCNLPVFKWGPRGFLDLVK